MTLTRKHSLAALLLAAPLLLPAGAALARDDDGGKSRAEWHHDMCTDHYAHAAGKLAYLQAKLGITDKQQDAWNKFYQAEIDGAAKERDACLAEKPDDRDNPPSVLDQEAKLETMLSNKLDALRSSRPALEDLYKVLTADQKDEFDQFGEEMKHHWEHGPGHEHGPEHGPKGPGGDR